jgi:hypothetical protein
MKKIVYLLVFVVLLACSGITKNTKLTEVNLLEKYQMLVNSEVYNDRIPQVVLADGTKKPKNTKCIVRLMFIEDEPPNVIMTGTLSTTSRIIDLDFSIVEKWKTEHTFACVTEYFLEDGEFYTLEIFMKIKDEYQFITFKDQIQVVW